MTVIKSKKLSSLFRHQGRHDIFSTATWSPCFAIFSIYLYFKKIGVIDSYIDSFPALKLNL